MKKTIVAALVVAGSLLTFQNAMADSQTVSVGWAHSDAENLNDLDGVNVQYRYEWNSPVSLVTSFTYMSGSDDDSWRDVWGNSNKQNVETKYYSLLAGPAYRINEYVSLYGLIGAAYTKADVDYKWRSSVAANEADGHKTIHGSDNSTNVAYAVGVSINPMENLAIYLGYEGSSADIYDDSVSIDGFNLGLGYRF